MLLFLWIRKGIFFFSSTQIVSFLASKWPNVSWTQSCIKMEYCLYILWIFYECWPIKMGLLWILMVLFIFSEYTVTRDVTRNLSRGLEFFLWTGKLVIVLTPKTPLWIHLWLQPRCCLLIFDIGSWNPWFWKYICLETSRIPRADH